jgi:hypothetical protein
MIPLTLPVELLLGDDPPVVLGAVDVPDPFPALVFEPPPELPQAASSATPPAPAPISSWRRGQANVDGAAAELSDKRTSEIRGTGEIAKQENV